MKNLEPSQQYGLPADISESSASGEIASRFTNGFKQFVTQNHSRAVMQFLKQELPHLAKDDTFIQRATQRLNAESLGDRPFIFLAINPQRQLSLV